jgi:hypothetical protein
MLLDQGGGLNSAMGGQGTNSYAITIGLDILQTGQTFNINDIARGDQPVL